MPLRMVGFPGGLDPNTLRLLIQGRIIYPPCLRRCIAYPRNICASYGALPAADTYIRITNRRPRSGRRRRGNIERM